jgi:hypothetical protein
MSIEKTGAPFAVAIPETSTNIATHEYRIQQRIPFLLRIDAQIYPAFRSHPNEKTGIFELDCSPIFTRGPTFSRPVKMSKLTLEY